MQIRNRFTSAVAIIGALILISCGTSKPYYSEEVQGKIEAAADSTKEIEYQFFLIGDAGLPNLKGPDKTLDMLATHLQKSGSSSSVIFLGDNIYEDGMPEEKNTEERRLAEQKIIKSLEPLRGYPGEAFFIPGNHDWRFGKKRVLAQETFIEQYPDAEANFLPDGGCPGPVALNLSDEWLMIALDTEWWISQSIKPNNTVENCLSQTREEVMTGIENIVDAHEGKHILVAAHHPLYSNGPHRGKFSWKDHLFPLTNIKPWLYLPLPVIGSTYPIYRHLGLSAQDISNAHYQEFIAEILEATEEASNRYFASGHEHNLAFYDMEDHYAIVSGSASKLSNARKGLGEDFVYEQKGFSRLISYKDGSVVVEFYVPGEELATGELVFRKELVQPERSDRRSTKKRESTDELIETAAEPGFEASGLKRFIWGSNYRDAWTTPVEVPVLDLDKKNGGLEVLNVGGGQQSVSITVQDSTGQKYIMRSVQKNPTEALPEELRDTFANNIVQDQISAAHPYGALIIPHLAHAAGAYHPAPELAYIPESEGLEFTDDSEGVLVLFEEFVNESWFNKKYKPENKAITTLDTDALWSRLREDHNNRINERQLLKSRLFDMFLGDWDRHDGQWFWIAQPSEVGTVFEPVPIDRDNAFFKSDGLIPKISNRKWALRKFQHFDEGIRDIAGINFNAKDFDRWFLSELDREDWQDVAVELQQVLTDKHIEKAVREWPDPIYKLDGNEVIHKLKARRDKIPEFAERYYDMLSAKVNIYGSDKPELFQAVRSEDGAVSITVYSISGYDQKGNKIYERTFEPEETTEVRLYGFGGDDRFDISGESEDGMIIRIIGGEGQDRVQDLTQIRNGKRPTKVYDTTLGIDIDSLEKSIKAYTTGNPRVNRFRKESFQYDYIGPLLTGGYNADDGVFLGGGVLVKTHGFRKEPYANLHEVKGKHSTLTSAFSFSYRSIFTELLGSYDLETNLDILAPNFRANFFGLGNETERTNDARSFYRFRYDQALFSVALKKRISPITSFKIGPGYKFFEASSTPDRFVSSTQAGLESEDFKTHHYASLNSSFNIHTVDNEVFPKYGIKVNAEADLHIGLNSRSETFGRLGTTASLYYSLGQFPATFAFRTGATTNIGDYEFFQANTLGGNSLLGEQGKLRGYLRDRFAGRTRFFQNAELRMKLFNFNSYLFPADVGLLGFLDNGRVWHDDENSNLWHQGYGTGIWISPFKRAVITTTFSFSEEDRLFSVNFGFGF